MGHARALSKIESAEKIKELADKVVKENMSVRELEQEIQEHSCFL